MGSVSNRSRRGVASCLTPLEATSSYQGLHDIPARTRLSPHLLHEVGQFAITGRVVFGANPQLPEFLIRGFVATITLNSIDHGHQVLHCDPWRLALSGDLDLEMPGRPLAIRILDESNFWPTVIAIVGGPILRAAIRGAVLAPNKKGWAERYAVATRC